MMKRLFFTLLCGIAAALTAAEPEFAAKISTGEYVSAGTPVDFEIVLRNDGKPIPDSVVMWSILFNGKVIDKGQCDGSAPLKISCTKEKYPVINQPGWLAVKTNAKVKGKTVTYKYNHSRRAIVGGAGVLIDIGKIRPGKAAPADFLDFWKQQREELNQVPIKATYEPYPAKKFPKSAKGKVEAFDVKVTCSGPKPVSGYLFKPVGAQPKSLPAIVFYHGAGVRSARPHFDYGTKAICFDVNAHGIPNGKPQSYYDSLAQGELSGYRNFGAASRDTVYFRYMYHRVMRALDFVKQMPEWNGKDLIVYGHSQGGGQSIAAACLDPQVTVCLPMVHANGDHFAQRLGRKPGWPYFLERANSSDLAKVEAAVQYYDNAFFAANIKPSCKVWMSTGLLDTTCVPTSVFAYYNSLPDGIVKRIYLAQGKDHNSGNPEAALWLHKFLGIEK